MSPKKAKGGAVSVGADPGVAERAKVAELLKKLGSLHGKSLVSIAVPAGGDLDRASDWLCAEQATASAMRSADAKRLLTEGLALAKDRLILFCGEVPDTNPKARPQQIAIEFSPFKPIRTSLLFIGTSFNTAALRELLDDGSTQNIREDAVLTRFLDEVTRCTGKVAYGVKDTIQALEAAAVVTLIVWEGLDLRRVHVRGMQSGEERDLFLTPAEEKAGKRLRPEGGEVLERIESSPFTEWIRDYSWVFGVELELVSGGGEKGSQFREGYGGIAAMLRYRIDFDHEYES